MQFDGHTIYMYMIAELIISAIVYSEHLSVDMQLKCSQSHLFNAYAYSA